MAMGKSVSLKQLARCLVCALVLGVSNYAVAQTSQEEHSQHHPERFGGTDARLSDQGNARAGAAAGPTMGAGMGAMMDGMMEKMGAPKPKDLYPSLMSLPDLSAEKRTEVLIQAHARMQMGASLMEEGLGELSHAVRVEDHAAMQEAVEKLKESLAQFDSGLAAKRALEEGKTPRNVALQWFKHEMNLLSPTASTAEPVYGGPAFHLSVIAILGSFVAAMLWMYFSRMRRASALLARLEAGGAPISPTSEPAADDTKLVSAEVAVSAPAPRPEFPVMKSKTVPLQLWSGRLRLCRVFSETPGVKTFRLAAENGVDLPFTYFPGQFITLSLTLDGKSVKRSYTIASAPTQRHYCSLTVKREERGLVSRYLHDQAREDDLIEVSGPSGKFTFTGEEAGSIVLIGGGVGITPLMSVIRYLTDVGWRGDIFLLYCCRTTHDFIFREELEQLQKRHLNLHVHATMTRAAGTIWMGLRGRFSAALIKHLIPEIAQHRVHVCGPPSMMSSVLSMLETLHVPDQNVKTEAFGPARNPAPQQLIGNEKAQDESAASAPQISFKRSKRSAPLLAGQTVLDAAEANGIDIENSCRLGQCGLCKIMLLSGTVSMACEDALSDSDKQNGLILACQAIATDDIEVDA